MVEINKMTEIDKFFKNWDDWHANWFNQLNSIEIPKINDWKLPCDKKGNHQFGNQDNFIYKYFPEPFLHKGDKSKIKYLFLNINPGGGGDIQDFDKRLESELFKSYNNKLYSETIKEFLITDKVNGKPNKTAAWYNKRQNWAESIYGKDYVHDGSVLCTDLIPWHTKKESDAIDYITENQNVIFKSVIEPLMEIALEIENPKIIVRGVAFFNLINAWLKSINDRLNRVIEHDTIINSEVKKIKSKEILEKFIDKRTKEKKNIKQYIVIDAEEKFFDKFNSYLAEYNFSHKNKVVTFYVFSGGANMDLPNADYIVKSIFLDSESLTLKDFLNDSSHNRV